MSFDLLKYAKECNVERAEEFVVECAKLREFLVEANKITNLTRITEEEDFAIKHVADSLSIARCFPKLATERLLIADIGCGAGFPSLVLAMAFPNLSICAIDSTGKKIKFVASAAEHLGLKNLRAVQGRSTELNHKAEFKHKFDIVTARAVAESPTIYLDAKDFINRRGRFIFYKTPEQIANELPILKRVDKFSKLEWHQTEPFELPNNSGTRQFLYS